MRHHIRIPFLLALMALFGPGSVHAQSSIGRPRLVDVNGTTIHLGSYSAETAERATCEDLLARALYLDTLLEGMEKALLALLPDSCRNSWCMEHNAWASARGRYCALEAGSEEGSMVSAQRSLCNTWAGTARLEDMLMYYDQLMEELER